MDKFSKPERDNSTEADTNRALVRVAAFFLLFFTTHWLLRWLHPIGAQWLLWNALGALASWLIVDRLMPERKHSDAKGH
jgi:threonine/homoserine/homoserine lactone efflux protein